MSRSQPPSLSAAPDEGDEERPVDRRRDCGPQALAGLVEQGLARTLSARGFADMSLHRRWTEIAGPHLAPWSEPVSLRWPRRGPGADPEAARGGAVLAIRVESAFALELQHMTPQIVERVNRFLGWRCVAKIALVQGPVRKERTRPQRRQAVLDPDSSRRLDALLAPLDDGEVKAALQRLGVAVMGKG